MVLIIVDDVMKWLTVRRIRIIIVVEFVMI